MKDVDVIIQVTGTLFESAKATINMRVIGGPVSIQLTTEAITLSKVWNSLTEELAKNFNLPLPSLSGTPWVEVINEASVIPSIWLSPSGKDKSKESASLEFAFCTPIKIGGKKIYNGIEITLLPHINVEAIYISYEAGGKGFSLRAKISTPDLDNDSSNKTQIVSYPFPLPPQNSTQSFQLHYIGLGQRVGPTVQVTQDSPMDAIFDQLENQLVGSDPVTIIEKIAKDFYHPDRDWFIAADLGYKGWRLRMLFNDPTLYGLQIRAPKESSSFFAGLYFEILYQKLGPNLGVYYGALTLPDKMRRIPMNGFILILPGFSIWIYTNGDFRLNVGWPMGSNSIGITMDILTGQAGFYIARLRSTDNPGEKPNAYYNPILAFGIGLSVSAGVAINSGIFRASASITVSATLQGLLAWKTDSSGATTNVLANPPDHYWFAGTASIAILVQGSIDFAIISASVCISVTLYADVAFETGYSTQINASADVSVSVSVRVLFFKIHLSFHTSIKYSFNIGSGDKSASIHGPQGMGSGIDGQKPNLLHREALRQVKCSLARLNRGHSMPIRRRTVSLWSGESAERTVIDLYLVLQPTTIYSLTPTATTAALVATLVAPCTAPGETSQISSNDVTSFSTLVVQLVTWLLDSYTEPDASWTERFKAAARILGSAGTAPSELGGYAGFTEKFTDYLREHVQIRILSVSDPSNPPFKDAALIPIFPQLSLCINGSDGPFIDFSSFNPTPANYEYAIDLYFAALKKTTRSTNSYLKGLAHAELSGPSIASLLFGDYYLMLARHTIDQLLQDSEKQRDKLEVEFLQSLDDMDHLITNAHTDSSFNVGKMAEVYAQSLVSSDTLKLLLDEFDYAGAAGISSRFMLQGLQLPVPSEVPVDPTSDSMANVPTQGIYALSGQQFNAPLGSETVSATLKLSPNLEACNWISFEADSSPPSTSTDILLPKLMPEIPMPEKGSADNLSAGEIAIRQTPAVLSQPLQMILKNKIAWQAPTQKQKAILPLPQDLQQLVQQKNGLQLSLTRRTSSDTTAPTNVAAIPALLIRLSISQVQQAATKISQGASESAQKISNIYQLNGTDEQTRELIYQALKDPERLKGASISLIYKLPGESTDAQSDEMHEDSLLFKTNLSTLNQAPKLRFMGAENQDIDRKWASLDGNVEEFLRLVWELSVVQAPGFFMIYKRFHDGKGLPEELFEDSGQNKMSPDPSDTINSIKKGTAQFDILVNFSPQLEDTVQLPAYANAVWIEEEQNSEPLYAFVKDRHGETILSYSSSSNPGSIVLDVDWIPRTVNEPSYANIPVDELYHLLSFKILEEGAYKKSVWSLPSGPTGNKTDSSLKRWHFQKVVPISSFLATQTNNVYDIVDNNVSVEFAVVDTYGNFLPKTLNATFLPKYRDSLISIGSWPNTQTCYWFRNNTEAVELVITLTFSLSALKPLDNSQYQAPNYATQLKQMQLRYEMIKAQLSDPGTRITVDCSLKSANMTENPKNELLNFVERILKQIEEAFSQNNFDPAPIEVSINESITSKDLCSLGADIQPLNVTMTMARDSERVDPMAKCHLPQAVCATYNVSPAIKVNSSTSSSTLDDFAQKFENAFDNFDGNRGKFLLCQQVIADDVQDKTNLWVVRWSSTYGIHASFKSDLAFFALKPLHNAPINGTVGKLSYSKIDIDLWAKQFLEAMDDLMSPEIATKIILLDKKEGKNYWGELLMAKKSLASSISNSLNYIIENPEERGDIEQARKRLKAAMLSTLSSAYSVSTIVQAKASIDVQNTKDQIRPSSLFGSVSASHGGSDKFDKHQTDTSCQYILSGGDLPLESPSQWMTIMTSVADSGAQSVLSLPLTYNVTFLQQYLKGVQDDDGYEPSSWLKFILADQDALNIDITGQSNAEIPIVFPLQPMTPTLIGQSACMSSPPESEEFSTIEQIIANAMVWDYQVKMNHDWVQQDRLIFQLRCNSTPSSHVNKDANKSSSALALRLFEPLGLFMEAYPSLSTQLKEVQLNINTVKELVGLINSVAEEWAKSPSTAICIAGSESGLEKIDDFMIEPINDESLKIKLCGRSYPPINGNSPQIWPKVSLCISGNQIEGIFETTPQLNKNNGWWEVIVNWPNNLKSTNKLNQMMLVWPSLSVMDRQTANIHLQVKRNADLIKGQPISPEFIYETETVSFTGPVIPCIEVPPLQKPLEPEETLTATLNKIVKPMKEAGKSLGAKITLETGYCYNLVHSMSDDSLNASCAVSLAKDVDLQSELDSFSHIKAVSTQIAKWYRAKRMPSSGATLNIALTVLASVNKQQVPLVRFINIPISVEKVSDGWWQ